MSDNFGSNKDKVGGRSLPPLPPRPNIGGLKPSQPAVTPQQPEPQQQPSYPSQGHGQPHFTGPSEYNQPNTQGPAPSGFGQPSSGFGQQPQSQQDYGQQNGFGAPQQFGQQPYLGQPTGQNQPVYVDPNAGQGFGGGNGFGQQPVGSDGGKKKPGKLVWIIAGVAIVVVVGGFLGFKALFPGAGQVVVIPEEGGTPNPNVTIPSDGEPVTSLTEVFSMDSETSSGRVVLSIPTDSGLEFPEPAELGSVVSSPIELEVQSGDKIILSTCSIISAINPIVVDGADEKEGASEYADFLISETNPTGEVPAEEDKKMVDYPNADGSSIETLAVTHTTGDAGSEKPAISFFTGIPGSGVVTATSVVCNTPEALEEISSGMLSGQAPYAMFYTYEQ